MEKQLLILVAVVFVVVVAAIAFFAGGSGGGPVVVRFMGQPVVLAPVEGEDIACIGAPSGYMRVYFDKTSDVDGEHITVGYARKGDDAQSVTAWFEGRAEACGYTRVEKTSGAALGAYGVSEKYDKGNESLYFDVAVVSADNGETYTLVRIGRDVYTEAGPENAEESEAETETGSEEIQETPVSGDLQQWDNIIRPLLEKAVGPLTLANAASVQGSYILYYTTDKFLTIDDAQKIANQFTSAGWQQLGMSSSMGAVSMNLLKENHMLIIAYEGESKEIQVTVLGGG